MILEPFFVTVDEAQDGKVAFEKIRDGHFDIVITDLRMPNCSGVELISKINQLDVRPYVVVVSGYATEEEKENLEAMGVEKILEKPLKTTELTDLIKNIK